MIRCKSATLFLSGILDSTIFFCISPNIMFFIWQIANRLEKNMFSELWHEIEGIVMAKSNTWGSPSLILLYQGKVSKKLCITS